MLLIPFLFRSNSTCQLSTAHLYSLTVNFNRNSHSSYLNMCAKSTMALPASLLASIFLFSLPHLTIAASDTGDECSCFRTNGSSQGYFLNHQFHDYRNVAGASSPPALTTNATNATNAFATSSFFLQDEWRNEWAVQNWNNSDSLASSGASILMVNTPNNVYIGTTTRP